MTHHSPLGNYHRKRARQCALNSRAGIARTFETVSEEQAQAMEAFAKGRPQVITGVFGKQWSYIPKHLHDEVRATATDGDIRPVLDERDGSVIDGWRLRFERETWWPQMRFDDGSWLWPDCSWRCADCDTCLGCDRKGIDFDAGTTFTFSMGRIARLDDRDLPWWVCQVTGRHHRPTEAPE